MISVVSPFPDDAVEIFVGFCISLFSHFWASHFSDALNGGPRVCWYMTDVSITQGCASYGCEACVRSTC